MTHKTHSPKTTILALILCFATAGSVVAAGGPSIDSSLVSWDAMPGYKLTLTVSGGGQDFRYDLSAGEPATFSLFDEAGQLLPDGGYSWQLTAAPALSKGELQILGEARDAGLSLSDKAASGFTESGDFTIAGGAFVSPSTLEGPANKDVVHADDVIVQGSSCVGFDCVNGENFGADTLRLKENNLRIHFDDTSSSGSFPSNDWRIVANDSANGGANYLAIEDSTGGKTPFKVEAGAGNNALYVEADGDIGIGTNNPVVDLHIVTGNTPAIRLEQDGSSGFTAQSWDLAGNESNFFVRDVTNGSKLPLQIKPGAPTASIFVKANADVGLNTASPSASLHVKRTDGTAKFLVEEASGTEATRDMIRVQNNGTTRIAMQDTSADGDEWQFAVNGAADAFVITAQASGGTEFSLNKIDAASHPGRLTISGDLVTGGGTCSMGCDALFQSEVESIEDHATHMWENSYLEGVGPTSPDEPWNVTEKVGGILNELEKAHIYIEQLNNGLKAKEDRISQLETAVAELKALVEAQSK
jgi:hypothetical protein